MDPRNDRRWLPSPELLAAYFDGEFEGRDDLAAIRQCLEDWLAVNPCARAELAEYRRLRQLWLETTPQDPPLVAWHDMLHHLQTCRAAAPGRVRFRGSRARRLATVFAMSAACLLLTALFIHDGGKIGDNDEPFPVASASEVVILHIDGPDANMLVLGQLPVDGPLELAGPGDVTFTSVAPAARDQMLPEVHAGGPGRPMIWARAEAEED